MTIQAVVFDAYGTLYDVQSVAAVTEEAFPGYGEIITQIWRIKQLEYSWLRSLMRRYQDFSVITRESLAYTIRVLGLEHDADTFERIMDKYLHLDLYPDALSALMAMKGRKLAILSNGSSRDAQRAGAQQRSRPRAGRHHQRRLPRNLQAGAGRLRLDRIDAWRAARRGAVRVVEPVGCLWRQVLWTERRLDRAGDAGSDGAGLRQE